MVKWRGDCNTRHRGHPWRFVASHFDAPGDLPQGSGSTLAVRAVLVLNGAAVLVLGLAPNALIQLCARVIG